MTLGSCARRCLRVLACASPVAFLIRLGACTLRPRPRTLCRSAGARMAPRVCCAPGALPAPHPAPTSRPQWRPAPKSRTGIEDKRIEDEWTDRRRVDRRAEPPPRWPSRPCIQRRHEAVECAVGIRIGFCANVLIGVGASSLHPQAWGAAAGRSDHMIGSLPRVLKRAAGGRPPDHGPADMGGIANGVES